MDDRFSIGNTKEQALGSILDIIADELDIPEDLRKEMVRKYKHLGEWIKSDNEERFKTESEIYPQGSVRLGTIVQPVTESGEYDVDLVYLRRLAKTGVTQEGLVEQAEEQLNRYIKHRRDEGKDIPTLERRRRCIALNYDGRFHMDVLPALPDDEGAHYTDRSVDTSILLTDRELREWQHSNPKAYSEWFRDCQRVAFDLKMANMASEGNVSVEEIPSEEVKTPLQIAIQILKRHRDVTYKGDSDDKPISIIITTLAATVYQNELNIVEALVSILEKMEKAIVFDEGKWNIPNPVNSKENFADKWNEYPQRAERFIEWLNSARADLSKFLQLEGLDRISFSLSESFGSDIVERSIKRYGSGIDESQQEGKLKMAAKTGLLGTTGATLPKNTWHGKS